MIYRRPRIIALLGFNFAPTPAARPAVVILRPAARVHVASFFAHSRAQRRPWRRRQQQQHRSSGATASDGAAPRLPGRRLSPARLPDATRRGRGRSPHRVPRLGPGAWERPDPDRLTRVQMTRTRPGRGQCWVRPPPVRGPGWPADPRPDPAESDACERAVEAPDKENPIPHQNVSGQSAFNSTNTM